MKSRKKEGRSGPRLKRSRKRDEIVCLGSLASKKRDRQANKSEKTRWRDGEIEKGEKMG